MKKEPRLIASWDEFYAVTGINRNDSGFDIPECLWDENQQQKQMRHPEPDSPGERGRL